MTYNAPTIYQWFTGTALAQNKWVGIGLAALAVALVGGLLLWRQPTLTTTLGLQLGLVCVLAIPFFLPEMHERYFYLADVLAIIYAFYIPRAFPLPIGMQIVSLLSYAPYLFRRTPVGLSFMALLVLALLVVAATQLVKAVQQNEPRRSDTSSWCVKHKAINRMNRQVPAYRCRIKKAYCLPGMSILFILSPLSS